MPRLQASAIKVIDRRAAKAQTGFHSTLLAHLSWHAPTIMTATFAYAQRPISLSRID